MSERTQAPGDTVSGRFRLGKCLGRGGQASVWLAQDLELNREIALKLPTPKARGNANSLLRLEREAELLKRLDHPNIARCYAYSLDVEQPYMAMEYVRGVSLARELEKRAGSSAHFEPREIHAFFDLLLDAIAYAHRMGVVHRDLKPDNIMFADSSAGPIVKVLDLGVARLLEQDEHAETTQGRVIGSVMYMSPEQAMGERTDERADIFALGVILFEVTTLRRAWAQAEDGSALPAYLGRIRLDRWNAPTEILGRMLDRKRPRPGAWRDDIPPALDEVVERALAVDRERRIASAGELALALDEVFGRPEEATRLTVLAEPSQSDLDSTRDRESDLNRAVLALRVDEVARARLVAVGPSYGSTITGPGISTEPSQYADVTPRLEIAAREPTRNGRLRSIFVLSAALAAAAGLLVGVLSAGGDASTKTQTIAPQEPIARPAAMRPPRVEPEPTNAEAPTAESAALTPSVSEPPRTETRERSKDLPRRATPRPPRDAPPPGPDRELLALAEQLRALRQNPADLSLFNSTGRAIVEAAERRVSAESKRDRIKRLATASMRVADLAQLERALVELRDAAD